MGRDVAWGLKPPSKRSSLRSLHLTPPQTYLVELMHPLSGEVVLTDVCAHLDAAVQRAIDHSRQPGTGPVRSEVSVDQGVLEGIAFFNQSDEIIACVTRYHLERDTERARQPEVARACSDIALAQDRLNQLLNASS